MSEQNTNVKKVCVKLVKSPIGYASSQSRVLRALGLRKMNQVVCKDATPPILGMLRKVVHLVEISETA